MCSITNRHYCNPDSTQDRAGMVRRLETNRRPSVKKVAPAIRATIHSRPWVCKIQQKDQLKIMRTLRLRVVRSCSPRNVRGQPSILCTFPDRRCDLPPTPRAQVIDFCSATAIFRGVFFLLLYASKSALETARTEDDVWHHGCQEASDMSAGAC